MTIVTIVKIIARGVGEANNITRVAILCASKTKMKFTCAPSVKLKIAFPFLLHVK